MSHDSHVMSQVTNTSTPGPEFLLDLPLSAAPTSFLLLPHLSLPTPLLQVSPTDAPVQQHPSQSPRNTYTLNPAMYPHIQHTNSASLASPPHTTAYSDMVSGHVCRQTHAQTHNTLHHASITHACNIRTFPYTAIHETKIHSLMHTFPCTITYLLTRTHTDACAHRCVNHRYMFVYMYSMYSVAAHHVHTLHWRQLAHR